MNTQKTVALCVTGSIAAYKAPQVARILMARGHRVLPLMTQSAEKFLGASTLAGLTGQPVHRDAWDASRGGELHIELASQADVIAVVPATADILARFASGRADDLVAALVLAAASPVLVAPAMHPRMWAHAAVMANVALLRSRGVQFAGPVFGAVASGEAGLGRMCEPDAVADAIEACMSGGKRGRDMCDLHVLVSAGPTYEDLDPVRFLGNKSSGKMGFAIAAAAAARGARVTLVAGPVELASPNGVVRMDVRSALEMRAAMLAAASSADVVVMAAAVADYRPAHAASHKLKKSSQGLQVEWVQNPDILAELVQARVPGSVLVGFALETGTDAEVLAYAHAKLARKGCDLLVANAASDALGADENRVHLVRTGQTDSLPQASKHQLADHILDAALAARVSRTR